MWRATSRLRYAPSRMSEDECAKTGGIPQTQNMRRGRGSAEDALMRAVGKRGLAEAGVLLSWYS
jgi:hypothetical protein